MKREMFRMSWVTAGTTQRILSSGKINIQTKAMSVAAKTTKDTIRETPSINGDWDHLCVEEFRDKNTKSHKMTQASPLDARAFTFGSISCF